MSNIVILTGSEHKSGTSLFLADNFEKGAKKSGNNIVRYDTAFLNVQGCSGCNFCRSNSGICCRRDDFGKIIESIIKSDIVAFVTPLYYFGMSAQLKKVVDRFHCVSNILNERKRGTFLLVTQASLLENATEVLLAHYEKIINYLKWENLGILVAKGVATKEDIMNTEYPSDAEKLGENIK